MIVSTLSTFLSGSKNTRLFRHGIAGHDVEMVPVSWTAKPSGSSRCVTLSVPPDFGVWLTAGPLSTTAEPMARMPTRINERRGVMVALQECARQMPELTRKPLPSQQLEQQMQAVETAAGQAADEGAVDPDVLQVVAGVLLDESDGTLGTERANTV